MPHTVRGRISDDLASSDEIKTYKDEGEEEKRASENLLQEKNDLLFESERVERIDKKICQSKYNFSDTSLATGLSLMGYPFFNHANIPSPLYPPQRVMDKLNPLYDSSLLLTPPPAHTRSSSWHLNLNNNKQPEDLRESSEKLNTTLNSNFWPLFNLPLPNTGPQDSYNWYSPNSFANLYSNGWFLPGLPYPYVSPPPSILTKYIDDQIKHYNSNLHETHLLDEISNEVDTVQGKEEHQITKLDKSPHIKKPLNAFMIFMKEMRQKIMDECTLKESAAINQILGRKWHSLERSEQMRYYELAQKEKELHQQKYPTWSARDNYAIHTKKQRKKNKSNHKLDDTASDKECNVSKKCRARYGVDQQNKWCKPCRRKKRCIRYICNEKCSSENDIDSGMDDNFDK